MALKIIFGKPGSGKSYHCVSMLAKELADWSRFETREGETFSRRLFTNLPLDIDAFSQYIKSTTGNDFDAENYITLLDDTFFQNANGSFWWEKFPEGALIVVDEVHHYLGAELSKVAAVELVANCRNYLSTHRHRRQDIIFLTQAVENVARPILSIADQGIRITNVKNVSFGFPLNISMADIDVIFRAFGNKRQVYNAQVGTYVGRSLKFDGIAETCVMDPAIFALYKSNTLSAASGGDRPDLNLSRIGAILWFLRKHFLHLSLKIAFISCVLFAGYDLLVNGPEKFTKAWVAGRKTDSKQIQKAISPPVISPTSIYKSAPIEEKYIQLDNQIQGYLPKSIIVNGKQIENGREAKVYDHEGIITAVTVEEKSVGIRDSNGAGHTLIDGVCQSCEEKRRQAAEREKRARKITPAIPADPRNETDKFEGTDEKKTL